MIQKICADCGSRMWRNNLADNRPCRSCGGTGKAEYKCSECGTSIPGSNNVNRRKTCGRKCAMAREARLAREKREARGLKRRGRPAGSKPTPLALSTTRKCHDCGEPTTDYRCAPCRATWRVKNHVEGLYMPESGGCPFMDRMPF